MLYFRSYQYLYPKKKKKKNQLFSVLRIVLELITLVVSSVLGSWDLIKYTHRHLHLHCVGYVLFINAYALND